MKKIDRLTHASGPLVGVKVLDLSRLISGNFLTFHLAEMGADVLKIEDPRHGDSLRKLTANGVPIQWKVYARNKRSAAIDLWSDEGKEILTDLIKGADVVVENFRPGTMERKGFGADKVLAINPKIVFARISGWGADGPYAGRPGFGTLVEAFSGFAAKTGFPDSGPLLPNLGLADLITGITGAFSVTAALRTVEVSGGEGQVIDLSLLESIVSFLGADPATCQLTGRPIARLGNRGEVAAPRNLYACADGRLLALSASTQSMAERLFSAMGRDDLITDPRFDSNQSRLQNHDEIDAIVADYMKQRPLIENLEHLSGQGVTVGPVHDALSVIEDAHVIDRKVYGAMDEHDYPEMPAPNTTPRLSQTPGGVHAPAPELGQHTRQVLTALGFDGEKIRQLVEQQIIKCADPVDA